jgi:hypothetical protein
MTDLAAQRRREAAAERDRRRNERRRKGCFVVPVEIHEEQVDVLVERRRLGEWDDRDRQAIGTAVEGLIADYCGATTRGNGNSDDVVEPDNDD